MTTLHKADSLIQPSFSPDGQAIVAVEDRKTLVVLDLNGKRTELGAGSMPSWHGNDTIAFVRDHEVWTVKKDGSGAKKLYGRNAGFEASHKGPVLGTADASIMLVVMRDVSREKTQWVPANAYPTKHFYGIGEGSTLRPINSTFFGGKASWLKDNTLFAHHEFDATGGARVHVTDLQGEDQQVFRGYFPKVNADADAILTVAHDFKSVQITSVPENETRNLELPKDLAGERFNNPAFWVDDETVLIEAKGTIVELGLGKGAKPIRRAKIDIARRGMPTMDVSADHEHAVYERSAGDGKHELVLVKLADWRKDTLPEPKPESDAGADESEADAKATEGAEA